MRMYVCSNGIFRLLALDGRRDWGVDNIKPSWRGLVCFLYTKYLKISLELNFVPVKRKKIYQSNFEFREAQSTKIVMAIAVFLTYPLQMYPVVEIFLPALQRRFSERLMVPVELAFRYFLVAVTCKFRDFMLWNN